ncbi:MAG: hypothetical protein QMD65_02130, partial [Patescibacteria group bacterium]|nr:hypothetical protein [Patescibacteria group bacterium]
SQNAIESLGSSQNTIKSWSSSQNTIKSWSSSRNAIESWDLSQNAIESWDVSQNTIKSWGYSVLSIIKTNNRDNILANGYSVVLIPIGFKVKSRTKNNTIIFKKDLNWFETNGIDKKLKKFTLYKKVSKNFETQENTDNRIKWNIGDIVEHKNWNPKENECGEGKFHACSRPFFCDEFRNELGDRYIAIEVDKEDLFEWKNKPKYPHKIAVRRARVLYEVDKFGQIWAKNMRKI